MATRITTAVIAAAAAWGLNSSVITAQAQAQAAAEKPPASRGATAITRGGPGDGPKDRGQLLPRFDRNHNGRLDGAERTAAYEWAQQNLKGARGGKGGGKPGKPGENLEPAQPGPKLTPAQMKAHPDTPLYDAGTLRTLFLEFDHPEWEKELAAFHRTDVDIPATLLVDGRRHADVGVHFHGASSFDKIPEGHKRSLVVALDFVHADQRLHGYRAVKLLNAHEDPSFLRTVLALHIARQYFPAPKANLTRVVINGECWGVYVNAQQFNKDFLKEWYGTTKGARWKVVGGQGGGLTYLGENADDYRQVYELKSKEDPHAWTALMRLCRTLNETPAESLEKALAPMLAVDETLKFLAWENVLMSKDGYWTKGADHSIYWDEKGMFHMVPYDANETFFAGKGQGGKGKPKGGKKGAVLQNAAPAIPSAASPDAEAASPVGLDPLVAANDPRRPLLSKLLQVPALRQRYLAYVREMADQWLDWKRLGPLAQQYQAMIDAAVKEDTRKLYSYDAFVRSFGDEAAGLSGPQTGTPISLKTFADQRRAFLLHHPK